MAKPRDYIPAAPPQASRLVGLAGEIAWLARKTAIIEALRCRGIVARDVLRHRASIVFELQGGTIATVPIEPDRSADMIAHEVQHMLEGDAG